MDGGGVASALSKEFTVCYSLRDLERERAAKAQDPLGPPMTKLPLARPRVVGAVAAVLVALVAAAALLFPASTPAVSSAKAAPPAAAATPVIEQTATTVDDGVPSGTDVARSGGGSGHCQHDL